MEEEDICHNITANPGMQMYQDEQNLLDKDNRIKYKPKDKGKRNKRTTNTLLKIDDGGEDHGNSRNTVISSRKKKE